MTKDEAIKAIEGKELTGFLTAADINYNSGLEDAIKAIDALPDAGWMDISEAKEIDGLIVCAGHWPNGVAWRAMGQSIGGYVVGDWDEGLEPKYFVTIPPPPEKA